MQAERSKQPVHDNPDRSGRQQPVNSKLHHQVSDLHDQAERNFQQRAAPTVLEPGLGKARAHGWWG